MKFKFILPFIIALISFELCFAHVSERALTLLLPTEYYIPAGISVLVLTIIITYVTPKSFISLIFQSFKIKSISINHYFFQIICIYLK